MTQIVRQTVNLRKDLVQLMQRHPRRTALVSALVLAIVGATLVAVGASQFNFRTMDIKSRHGAWQYNASVLTAGNMGANMGYGTLLFFGAAALGNALSQLGKGVAGKRVVGNQEVVAEKRYLWRRGVADNLLLLIGAVGILLASVGYLVTHSDCFTWEGASIPGAAVTRTQGVLSLSGIALGSFGAAYAIARLIEQPYTVFRNGSRFNHQDENET